MEPTSPSLMIQDSFVYSTGYMLSTISFICSGSWFFMKSFSWIAFRIVSRVLHARPSTSH